MDFKCKLQKLWPEKSETLHVKKKDSVIVLYAVPPLNNKKIIVKINKNFIEHTELIETKRSLTLG